MYVVYERFDGFSRESNRFDDEEEARAFVLQQNKAAMAMHQDSGFYYEYKKKDL